MVLVPWLLAGACNPEQPEPKPEVPKPTTPSLPPGWEYVQPTSPDRPEAETQVLFAAHGATVENAIDRAREAAAKARETKVDSVTKEEFFRELDPATGKLVEKMSQGSMTLSRSNISIREAAMYGRPVQQDLQSGPVYWVRVRVSEFHVYPYRALRDLIRQRPNDPARRELWRQQLKNLAEQYFTNKEFDFGVAALGTLARDIGTLEAHLDLARAALQHRLLALAKRTLDYASTFAGSGNHVEVAKLQAWLRQECQKVWNRLTKELETISRMRRDDSLFYVVPLGATRQARTAPLRIKLFSKEPRYVILLWLDADGLYRLPWIVDPGPLTGTVQFGNEGGTRNGHVLILAVASNVSVELDFLPPTGLEQKKLVDGDIDTLERVESLLKHLHDLVNQPTTVVGACEYDLE